MLSKCCSRTGPKPSALNPKPKPKVNPNPSTTQLADSQAASSAPSSHAARPHPQQLASNQLHSNTSQHSSAQRTSMHQRTPAPSFINRSRLPSQKPNPAMLSSDAPSHLKGVPLRPRPHHQNGSSLKPVVKPETAQAGPNAAGRLSPLQSASNLQDHSQEPQAALTKAFGSSNGSSSSSSKHGSVGLGSHGAADQLESKELLANSQASGKQSVVVSCPEAKTGSGSKQLSISRTRDTLSSTRRRRLA